ncbi:MAG: B12-binding domain-containing protein [Chloroflexi bacterium]|nr:B12-binding domain-containing protein [Chloroflexota bacterium]
MSPGKYRHGLALTPRAADLLDALLRGDRERALGTLVDAYRDEGKLLLDIEQELLAPALVKAGELWVRGRLGDSAFERVGRFAEQVERAFRRHALGPADKTS